VGEIREGVKSFLSFDFKTKTSIVEPTMEVLIEEN
jgi:hypothetical protein